MPDFFAWVQHHAQLFGLSRPEEISTLTSWEGPLSAAPADLIAASDWLAAHPEAVANSRARYVGKMPAHLDALHCRIQSQQAATLRQQAPEDPRGTCSLCGGSGMVGGLPDLRFVDRGVWRPVVAMGRPTWYSCAAYCRCALGKWKHERLHEDLREKVINLERYESFNPDWRIQVADRAEKAKALNDALEFARTKGNVGEAVNDVLKLIK